MLAPKVRVESSLHPTKREERRGPEASNQGQSRREERRVVLGPDESCDE